MLRISRCGEASIQTLKLEGKLTEPWIDEVIRVYADAKEHSNRIRLDLTEVAFVDAAGVVLLNDLIRRGVEIIACTRFVAELLHVEKP